MSLSHDEIRRMAEDDLERFIALVAPMRVLGDVHRKLCQWWERPEKSKYQLVLFPRDHMKSTMVAFRAAHRIIKNPAIKILYVSSTSNLANKQAKFVKDILTSKVVRKYWPELINEDENKREKWTETEFSVDHPLRKIENVRDPTLFTAGLTTNIVGMHSDVVVLDDVVVYDNAYTEDGRDKVRRQYSLLSSVASGNAEVWVVGTRYFPEDLYGDLSALTVPVFDEKGKKIGTEFLFEKFEEVVEDSVERDGSGEFLWPVQKRHDGREFGFNRQILEEKKANYLDKGQFFAQYYNDPNVFDGKSITRDYFQYYDRSNVIRRNNHWYVNGQRISVVASMDFAWGASRSADYSAIVVLGLDRDYNYYILDIDRFNTNTIPEYFNRLLKLYQKWMFPVVRMEITAAQEVLVKDIKNSYIYPKGIPLTVKEYRPSKNEGTKEERVYYTLFPKYHNKQMYHYQGGNCQILEEELLTSKPAHDDVKDCLAAAVDVAEAPAPIYTGSYLMNQYEYVHPRFGGVAI